MTTFLGWFAVYLTASVVGAALLAAAIRHGERQVRAERALIVRAHAARNTP